MRTEQKLFAVAILTALVLVGISAYFFMFVQALHQKEHITRETLESMSKEQLIDYILLKQAEGGPKTGYYVLPVAVFLSAIVGVFVSYRLLSRSEKAQDVARVNAHVLLQLLKDDERKVVEKLLEHGGEIRQYELVRMTDLGKVKVHRVLKSLEDRGVVDIEKIGKVNNVRLRSEIYDALRGGAKRSANSR
jgi:DNA-binding transcriptional ArsR family regulator